MYRRFSSYAFESCLDDNVSPEIIYTAVMSEGVGAAIPTTSSVNALLDLSMMTEKKKDPKADLRMMKAGWSQTIRPFSLPYGMDVVLGDVCGGSSSTSMVHTTSLLLHRWLLASFVSFSCAFLWMYTILGPPGAEVAQG